MASEDILSLDSRKDWRRWLRKNHHQSTGIWLTIHKKHVPLGIKLGEAVEEAICFGWIDSRMRSVDGDTFVLRFSPRRRNSPWSAGNRDTAVRMIREDKMTGAGLKAIEEAMANGKWESAYSSRTEPSVPDDLREALGRGQMAWQRFDALTNSRKMAFIFWVNSAKRPATRMKRIQEVVRQTGIDVQADP